MTISVSLKDDKSLTRYFEQAKAIADQAAYLAIEDSLRYGRARVKQEMLSQVDLKASYLDGKSSRGKRLDTRSPTRQNLEGAIIGRAEPTSLLRFVKKFETRNGRQIGAYVRVNKNSAGKFIGDGKSGITSAFQINLKNGNQGLAVRLPKGERPKGKAKKLSGSKNTDLYLLYAPSVQQLLINNENTGVAEDVKPIINRRITQQFIRQFERLSRANR